MSMYPPTSPQDSVEHSQPIPIGSAHSRRRSASISSSNSSGSPTSPIEPQTPLGNTTPPRMFPANVSPSKSPILSYFMSASQQPTKSNTFPSFSNRGRFGGAPVFEEEEEEPEIPVAAHARRASVAGTFGTTSTQSRAVPDAQNDRGTSLLRRLSIGGAFARPPYAANERIPSPPPNTAVSPTPSNTLPKLSPKGTRARRSATLNVDDRAKPRRAPSPMGERILKGHFDGFN